jgi:hypothetical protein
MRGLFALRLHHSTWPICRLRPEQGRHDFCSCRRVTFPSLIVHYPSAVRFLTLLVTAGTLAMLLLGCYPVALMQSPRTQAPGTVELAAAAPRVGVGSRRDQQPYQYLPVPEVSARIGVAEGWDIGGRARYCCAADASVKHQLMRSPMDLAVDLGVVNGRDEEAQFDDPSDPPEEDTYFTAGRLSVLAGWPLDESTSMWVATGLHAGHRYGDYENVNPLPNTTYSLPFVAPSVNLGLRVRLGSVVSLFGESGVLVPVAGEKHGTFGGPVRLGPGDYRFETILGFAFALPRGGGRAEPAFQMH